MVKSASKTPKKSAKTVKKTESETESETKLDDKFSRKASNKEARKYDYTKARGINRRTTNVAESIFLVLRTSLGGGLLTVHVAVGHCGVWTAMALNCGVGFIISYCMYILARSAQTLYGRTQVPSMTYTDLAEAAVLIGPWPRLRKYSANFRNLVAATKTIALFACCYVYQVLMARIIKQLVDETVFIEDSIPPTLRTYAVGLVIPILCVCMLVTSLSYLAPFCMVADTVFVLIAAFTAYYGIREANTKIGDMVAFKSKEGMVQYIGTFIFSAEGIATTLAIECNMTRPKKIGLVISAGMLIIILLTTIVGFFGFWGFQEDCTSPITVNFPWTPFPIMIKAFTIVTLLVTYALNYWLPFELLWYNIKPLIQPDHCKIWENVYRCLFVIVITTFTGLLPNVQDSVATIGCSFLICLGIIFPAFIDLLTVWEDPGLGKLKWRLLTDASMILGGITFSIFGTIFSIMQFASHYYNGYKE